MRSHFVCFWSAACLLLTCLLFSSVSATACPAQGYAVGQTTASMQRPEGTRYYEVYVPESYNPNTPAPLQFVFHGLNDNCVNFINETGFKSYADAEGFVLVAPCGTLGISLFGIAWNSGTCCGFTNISYPNDFEFARLMVQDLSAKLCIDKTKIVTAGFSNGAMMSEVLGCQEPNIFRAVASVSGVVELRPGNAQGLTLCSSEIAAAGSNRPAVLMIHGDADLLVPWTGDEFLGFPPIPDNLNGWVSRNKCSGQYNVTLNISHFTNQKWATCDAWGNEVGSVELVRNHGGGHIWPETKYFNATTYIHQFFASIWNMS